MGYVQLIKSMWPGCQILICTPRRNFQAVRNKLQSEVQSGELHFWCGVWSREPWRPPMECAHHNSGDVFSHILPSSSLKERRKRRKKVLQNRPFPQPFLPPPVVRQLPSRHSLPCIQCVTSPLSGTVGRSTNVFYALKT